MECPKCGGEMKRDVPKDEVSKDMKKTLFNPFHAVTSIVDYWTNDSYFKCKRCGYTKY